MKQLLRVLCIGWLAIAVCAPTVASQDEPAKRRETADFIGSARSPHYAGPWPAETRASMGASPVADGLAWLETDQNPDGSWGSAFEMIVTSTVLETLETLDPCSAGVLDTGAGWLAAQTAPNHDFLARQTAALAGAPGHKGATASLAAQLLATRNPVEFDTGLPNWPEGGWGIEEGFETDSLTTALALIALDRTGFNGGFTITDEPLAPGGTNVHEWEIPGDTDKVRFLITVGGSEIRLCMTEGAPPPFCSSFFPVPPGPTFLITLPDNGLPFTPGTNFVVVESTGPAATYTLTASYETPTFDTRTLAEPLAYLREAQNLDGGWGLQRGQPSEFYTTLHVLLTLLRYSQYDLATEIADGIAYVKAQQLGDGSFGFGGPGIPYVTALAALNLMRSETSPFSLETEDAVSALAAMQDVDGSWDQEAYDTALAMLALWDHDLPPTADAGPDQMVVASSMDCLGSAILSGSGSSPDGTIVSYEWTEDCVPVATGPTPTISLSAGTHNLLLTVVADDGQTSQDSVTVTVVDEDSDADGFGACTNDCDDSLNQVWGTPGEVLNVEVSTGGIFSWDPPADLGGDAVVYDVIRSSDPSDFETAGACIESDDGSDNMAEDSAVPPLGTVFFYLIRAENDCPLGQGPLGESQGAPPRFGLDCP